MSNLPAHNSVFATPKGDLATDAWVSMLRAAILSVPPMQRSAVFAQLRDLLPASILRPPPGPQRGGELLNNVFELFKNDPGAERSVAEVVQALSKQKPVEPQPVRLALSYLNSRRILQRIGYGKYRLEDGSIVDGIP